MNGNADGRVSLAISRRLSGNQCEESLINPYCPAPLTFFYVYTLPAVLSTGVLMAFSRTFSLLPVTHVTGVWLFTSVTTVQSTLFFQQFTVVWSGHGVSFLFNNRLSNLLSAPLACSCVLAHESTRTRVSTYLCLFSCLSSFFARSRDPSLPCEQWFSCSRDSFASTPSFKLDGQGGFAPRGVFCCQHSNFPPFSLQPFPWNC